MSFASRTPENSNPERVGYRRSFVTRHQVSGWRFVMRRIASGVALHDTRMLVDPLRTQSRAVLMGALLLLTGLLGCFVFSFIRPSAAAGNNPVLADRDTAALYVRVNDELHPVLNLTSARLAAGKPVNPVMVKSTELNKFPRGVLVGIPGAPERMVQGPDRDADWTVCDGAGSGEAGAVSVIAGPLAAGGARAAALAADDAVLVDNGAGTWLLWNGRRSLVDPHDRAVTSALGFGESAVPRPISPGLFNAVPEGLPLRAPVIPGAGGPPQFALPVPAPVGAVVAAYGADGAALYYAVLSDGLQPISPVLATVLRNTQSYGLQQPPRLGADDVTRLPVSHMLDTGVFPDRSLTLVDAAGSPLTCVHWTRSVGAGTSSLQLMSGSALPVPEGRQAVQLVAGSAAARAYLEPGIGYLVRTVGQEPAAPPAGALFWISDTGVRYGIDGGTDPDGIAKTIAALGLSTPAIDVPWSVLTLFSPGPALSGADALTAYRETETR